MPLLTEAVATSRQVYGRDELTTLALTGCLGILHSTLGEFVAAERLLTEAVSGFAAISGPQSPETMHVQAALRDNALRLEQTPKSLR